MVGRYWKDVWRRNAEYKCYVSVYVVERLSVGSRVRKSYRASLEESLWWKRLFQGELSTFDDRDNIKNKNIAELESKGLLSGPGAEGCLIKRKAFEWRSSSNGLGSWKLKERKWLHSEGAAGKDQGHGVLGSEDGAAVQKPEGQWG